MFANQDKTKIIH